MSTLPNAEAPATSDKPQKGPWRKLNRVIAIVSLVAAVILAVISTLTLDVLVGLTDYQGFWRVVLTVLFAVASLLISFCGTYFGLWIFTIVLCGFYFAYVTITGDGKNAQNKQTADANRTEP